MKKLSITLLLLLMCCMSGFADAGLETSDSNCTEKTRLVHHSDNPSNPSRPNLPSRLYIICEYSITNLRFILPTGIEWLKVSLGDEMFPIWEGFVNKSNPTTAIPNLTGEVKIMCEDNLGRKYYGTLYFDED